MTDAKVLTDALDEALFYAGEPITITRTFGRPPAATTAVSVGMLAVIRGFEPSDLAGDSGITQQDQLMIVSPAPIVASGWPGSTAGPGDARVPHEGDRVTSSRGVLTVRSAAGIYVDGVLVRIEMTVRGT